MGEIPVGRQGFQEDVPDVFGHKFFILTDGSYIVVIVAEAAYTDIFRNFQGYGTACFDQAESHSVIFAYDSRDAAAFQCADILLEGFRGRICYFGNDIFRFCGNACAAQRFQISAQTFRHGGRVRYAAFGEKADLTMAQRDQMFCQFPGAHDIIAQNVVQIGRGHRLIADDHGDVAEYKLV